MKNIRKTGYDMFYLCRCAMVGVQPSASKVERMDIDDLFEYSQMNCLTAMVYMALKNTGIVLDSKWNEAYAKAVRKNMLLDAEREQIAAFLEHEHIWYMPLKGAILKDFYPKAGMRQMSDNDILFDESKRKIVSKFMSDRGYRLKGNNGSHCDEWLKEPVYNFEMHLNLFTPSQDPTEYFSDVKDRLVQVHENGYAYRFTDEDFYIYMTAHAYKHFSGSGTGFRTLIDYYVFLNKKENELDWKYIDGEIEKLELTEFEKNIRSTSKKAFETKVRFSDAERRMVEYMLFSTTYGTYNNYIQLRASLLNTNSKSGYIMRRIFPNTAFYKKYWPITEKYPVLIPFIWLYRIYRMFTIRRENIIKEVKAIFKVSNKEFRRR